MPPAIQQSLAAWLSRRPHLPYHRWRHATSAAPLPYCSHIGRFSSLSRARTWGREHQTFADPGQHARPSCRWSFGARVPVSREHLAALPLKVQAQAPRTLVAVLTKALALARRLAAAAPRAAVVAKAVVAMTTKQRSPRATAGVPQPCSHHICKLSRRLYGRKLGRAHARRHPAHRWACLHDQYP